MKGIALVTVTAAALLALVVTGCGSPAPEPTPTTVPPSPSPAPEATPTETPGAGVSYRIGFAPDVTGEGSFMGIPQRSWVEVTVERLEESGGIVGPDGVTHGVEIIIGDTASNPDVAASLARRYVNDDEVVALIMGSVLDSSLAVADVATQEEVPYISMSSPSVIITDPDSGEMRPWVFKVAQSNVEVAQWQVERLKAMGADSVCYLYENTDYGTDCYSDSSTQLAEAGLASVFEGTFGSTDTEFPQVAGIEAAACDVAVIGATLPGAANAHVAIRTALPDIPIIHGHGVCTTDLIAMGGEAVEGAELPCSAVIIAEDVPADNPAKQTFMDFKSAYEGYTRGPVSAFGGHAYDALHWVLEALESLPDGLSLEEQRAAVRDYIENNIKNWPGTAGVFNVSPADHYGLDYKSLTWFKVEGQQFVPFPEEQW